MASGGGKRDAATGPLAGVHVPHEREHAAIERFRDGVL
jgi:hypothetical protein